MGAGLRFWRAQAGASAVEFAMVVPAFLALTIGALNLCILLYINSTLHFAVDDAARCMSVKTTVCDTVAHTRTHALATFNFPSLSPTITPTFGTVGSGCGNQVTGAATYRLNAVVTSINVSLSAQSCFPIQN
jgi:Flp pilus assembly protein TadG